MKQTVSLSIFILMILFVGCAYFNTFYNARRYYEKAYQETKKNRTGKVTAVERDNYQRAIDKASKLLELYPKSKYADDAHFLLGKCFYYQQDYFSARRQFIEIQSNYPKSSFLAEATLWLAKTDLSLDLFEESGAILNRLVRQKIPNAIKGEAYYFLGKYYEKQQNHENAVESYLRGVEVGVGEMKAEAMFSIGANYDALGMYDKAEEYFRKVLDADPERDLRFEAQLRYAEIIKKQNRFDEAIKLLENLLSDENNAQWMADIKLEIADCLVRKGDIDGAVITYQDIIKDHDNTDYAAIAHYALGVLYQKDRRDYERALDHFQKVRNQYYRSEYADSASVKAMDIQRLEALRQVIKMALRGEEGELKIEEEKAQKDSMSVEQLYSWMRSASDDSSKYQILLRAGGETFADSVMDQSRLKYDQKRTRMHFEPVEEKRPTHVDWEIWVKEGDMPEYGDLEKEFTLLKEKLKRREKSKWVENPELKSFRVDELDKNLFLLGELYLFGFFLPDSAENQYHRLLTLVPESPYVPRALYNLNYIAQTFHHDSAGAERYLRTLIAKYPKSRFSNAARTALGLPLVTIAEDSAEILFEEAETAFVDRNDPSLAFKKYERVWKRFPNSELAPKSAFAMAWISENRLNSLPLAFTLYDSLTKSYPNTVYAEKARKKIEAVRKKNETQKQEKSTSESAKNAETKKTDTQREGEDKKNDSTLTSSEEKLEKAVPAELLTTPASPEGGVNAILRALEISPTEKPLIDVVEVQVYVDAEGRAQQVKWLRRTGNPELDESVSEAIRKTKFRPAFQEDKPVSSWVTLSFPLGKK